MAKSVFDMPRQQLERLSKGADVRSIRLPVNAAIDVVNEMMSRPGPASQVKPPPVSAAGGFTWMKIVEVSHDFYDRDFILCKIPDGDGLIEPTDDAIYVARNYLCRHSPFAGQSRAGFTYTYINGTLRTSTVNFTETSIAEVITPVYYASNSTSGGDMILAQYFPTGVLGHDGNVMQKLPIESADIVYWLDTNADGRAWGKDNT